MCNGHSLDVVTCMAVDCLQVEFMEETAIDTGGPSRKFWRLFVQEVVQDYCVGDAGIKIFLILSHTQRLPIKQANFFDMDAILIPWNVHRILLVTISQHCY